MKSFSANVELLAPGGEPDAAYAAFDYGADAVYAGLLRFSARAEAVNFSPEELDELTAFAHSRSPPRRVFAAVNTVVLNREVEGLIETLGFLSDIGVDALIVQDLGVCYLARRYFPRLALHASTQMAIHNLEGARALRRLGFRRVTLARELTLGEIETIAAQCGLETEVFVHGALCYSYSGLCLYSSMMRNRSGNRGKCVYPCRDRFDRGTPRDGGFPFSMKDLSLEGGLDALREAGVASFKIEGRKKSPLYVAAACSYYRTLLDGTGTAQEREKMRADLQTVFSRPLTDLYLQSRRNPQTADAGMVGHRGALVGKVEAVTGARGGDILRFRTSRAIERHDGLQIEIPGEEKPFGFPVDSLWILGPGKTRKSGFEASAGSLIEVALPLEHPRIPAGAEVFCASSQAVKRGHPFARPKPGAYRTRYPVEVRAAIRPTRLEITASATSPGASGALGASVSVPGVFAAARDAGKTELAFRAAFEKLGDTRFALKQCALDNPSGLFLPVSVLNQARRDVCSALERQMQSLTHSRNAAILSSLAAIPKEAVAVCDSPRWSIKIDRLEYLDAFTRSDLDRLDELILDVTCAPPAELPGRLESLAGRMPREKIRLALPLIARAWDAPGLRNAIAGLRAAGWTRWQASGLSAWEFLKSGAPAEMPDCDLSADWPLYALNKPAVRQLLDLGATRVTLSPEDGLDNAACTLAAYPGRCAVAIYQDTPLFISETCAQASLAGACRDPARCEFRRMDLQTEGGERLMTLNRQCRSITLSREPFCLAKFLPALVKAGARLFRADFLWRDYTPAEVHSICHNLWEGRPVSGTRPGRFAAGLQ